MKKRYATFAKIVSLLLVILGFLTIVGVMGGDTYYPSSAPWNYDSGYATFGGDFYTYVVNNAGEAAAGSRAAASNLNDISTLLKSVCGIFLMGFGLLSFCFFGVITADDSSKSVAETTTEEVETAAADLVVDETMEAPEDESTEETQPCECEASE